MGDGVPEPPPLQAVRLSDAIPVKINTNNFVLARIQFLEYDLDL